jgi:hypothetical protein
VDELYDHGAPIGAEGVLHYKRGTEQAIERLGIALGISRLPNPEGGENYRPGGHPVPPEIETLLTAFGDHAGADVCFPNPFDGEIGLETRRGTATVRAIGAIYQAIRIKRMCQQTEVSSVIEIGAGMGRTAYYAMCFGITDYIVVDLPLSLIGQAVFLALTLGEDKICFASETKRDGVVSLLTPRQFHEGGTKCAVAINVDSMPEMDREHAATYLERLIRDQALFLSINHEANRHAVFEIAPASARVYRAPYLLRPGYMEEMYDFRR